MCVCVSKDSSACARISGLAPAFIGFNEEAGVRWCAGDASRAASEEMRAKKKGGQEKTKEVRKLQEVAARRYMCTYLYHSSMLL